MITIDCSAPALTRRTSTRRAAKTETDSVRQTQRQRQLLSCSAVSYLYIYLKKALFLQDRNSLRCSCFNYCGLTKQIKLQFPLWDKTALTVMSAGPAADTTRAKPITMKINIMSNCHGECCSSNLWKHAWIKWGIQILLSGAFKHIYSMLDH